MTTQNCPVHGIPDCSPLLNGCSRLTTPDPTTPERVTLTEGERIKALLDEHRWYSKLLACSCGWKVSGLMERGNWEGKHRAHVAEVIAREAGEREAQLRARVESVADSLELGGVHSGNVRSRTTARRLRDVLDQGDEGGA